MGGGTAAVGARSEAGGPGDPLSSAGATYLFVETSLGFFLASTALPESRAGLPAGPAGRPAASLSPASVRSDGTGSGSGKRSEGPPQAR